jgi:adenosylcobinamide-GDP ribazoletransferase
MMRDALSLLTTIGRRGGALTARALPWFPIVGAALGALVGGAWWVADQAWPPLAAAVVAVVVDLAVTGMLHVDGLADSADGLLPHATRERRLEIMRAPDVGAFGVTAVVAVLLVEVAGLASRRPSVLLVVALWCAARSLVAVVPAVVPYARPGGMATNLVEGATRWPLLALPVAVGLGAWGAGVGGAVAVVVGLLAGIGVIAVARQRLGGFTGDVLGATIVVTQAVGLLAAAARW